MATTVDSTSTSTSAATISRRHDPPATSSSRTTTTKSTSTSTSTTVLVRFYFIRHGESGANKWGLIAGQDDVPLTDAGIVEAKRLGKSRFIITSCSSDDDGNDDDENNNNDNGNNDANDDSMKMTTTTTIPPTTIPFWRIYSSDLSRAKDTAVYALNEGRRGDLIPTLQQDVRLRERSYGLRQGFSRSMPEEDILKVWKQYGREPPPYETDEQLWERGKEWIQSVLQEVINVEGLERQIVVEAATDNNDDDNNNDKIYHVLVAAHAGLIREIILNLVSHEKLVELGARFDAKRGNKLIIPNTSVSVLEINPFCDRPFENVNVVELLNADHLVKVNDHDD